MKIKRLIQAALFSGLLTILIAAPSAAATPKAAPDGLVSVQGGWCRVC